MKTLFLLRHGKADRPAGMLSDKERPLLKHGVKEVAKMCQKMVEKGMTVEVIVSSTAARALETAQAAAEELGYNPGEIEMAEVIYGAEADELGLFLRHQSDERNSLMLVGHNPGLEDLAEMLARGYSGHLPTGGIIALRLSIRSWSELVPGCGKVMATLFP
jgi:phosphohistidine phosphatase